MEYRDPAAQPRHAIQPTGLIDEVIRREEERHRAWLHDTVLQVLEYLATGGYGQCTDAERLMRVAGRAADDLREAIDGECDELPPPDFRDAISHVVNEARALSHIDVHLDTEHLDCDVEPIVASEIVAVVREALNNTRKHSGASNARVTCESHDGHVEVHVVDDGHGFDPRTVHEGLGMRCSMRERMARCGGSVAIASAPGRGVMIRITGRAGSDHVTESVA
ncbi:MAG: ATP-binding protein [Thermoleophilia bacterium]|nr:ATP-binding protein [Thermoleophilia bacterium]